MGKRNALTFNSKPSLFTFKQFNCSVFSTLLYSIEVFAHLWGIISLNYCSNCDNPSEWHLYSLLCKCVLITKTYSSKLMVMNYSNHMRRIKKTKMPFNSNSKTNKRQCHHHHLELCESKTNPTLPFAPTAEYNWEKTYPRGSSRFIGTNIKQWLILSVEFVRNRTHRIYLLHTTTTSTAHLPRVVSIVEYSTVGISWNTFVEL